MNAVFEPDGVADGVVVRKITGRRSLAVGGRYDVRALIKLPDQKLGRYHTVGYVEIGEGAWFAYPVVPKRTEEGTPLPIGHAPTKAQAMKVAVAHWLRANHPAPEPKPLVEVFAEEGAGKADTGSEGTEVSAVQPEGDRPTAGATLLDEVKLSAAFERWLAGSDLVKLSLWEAYKAGAEQRGAVVNGKPTK